jgi:uncharacterized protein YprB with RNaseH-like and TPR domain
MPDSVPDSGLAQDWSLAERLQRLDPTRRRATSCREPDEQALAEGLGAKILTPGVLLLERRHSLRRRHGRCHAMDCVATLPMLCPTAPSDPAGWAFIDTETSGLAGGTGTWAFTCGVGRIDGDDLLLRQWLLTRLDAEPAMLASFGDGLADVELLVSYNGKSFDLPLLLTRFTLAGLRCRLDALAHLDLLHPVRRAFAARWPDCRLATVEQRLLGFRRDGDLPGAEAPAAWLDWLGRGDGGRLGAVLRHNRLDLVSLAALVPALVRVERDPIAQDADLGALARHRLRCGDALGALALLSSAQPLLVPAERLLLASLFRRRGDWEQARAVWEGLAADNEPDALEALAKYHEHRSGDLRQALDLVRRLPPGLARDHRQLRLRRKLNTEPPLA